MEGLIPFVLNALKKNNKLHKHSYKSLSDGSRRSYHLLLAGGDSVNGGSSHRRTRSEFPPASSTDFAEYEPEGVFARSNSLKKDPNVSGSKTGHRVSQTRSQAEDRLPRRAAHQKWV